MIRFAAIFFQASIISIYFGGSYFTIELHDLHSKAHTKTLEISNLGSTKDIAVEGPMRETKKCSKSWQGVFFWGVFCIYLSIYLSNLI